MTAEGLGALSRLLHVLWMHHVSSTSSPLVPFLMCLCVLLPSGRLGSACAEVGLGFALLGWFRRFRPPPPPLVWFRARRPSLFFFLAFSGFCPLRARCVVLVFALSLFSCVPRFASWLSNCHFIFTLIHFHRHFICPAAAGCVRVCVRV